MMEEIGSTITVLKTANTINNFKNSVSNLFPSDDNNNNNNNSKEEITIQEEISDEITEAKNNLRRGFSFVKIIHGSIYNVVLKYSTPMRLWFFFTVCCFLNYVDRGAIAGSMPQIQIDFGLDDTEAGLVGASFMLGYMLMAPLFGHWSHYVRPQILMFFGLTTWICASFFTGTSFGFISLVIARTISGVGEASFAGLAPTYIDDIAPTKHRSLLLALFFAQITIGVAVGYAIGGFFTEFWSWRIPFFIDMVLMLPFAMLCPFIPLPEDVMSKLKIEPKKKNEDSDEAPIVNPTFLQSVYYLISNIRYVLIVIAYGCVVFVVGSLYFWAPTYVVEELGVELVVANIGIGGVAVFTGLIGTSFGGLLVDRLGGSDEVATLICLTFSIIIFPVSVIAFSLHNKYLFFILVTLGELLIFGITSPINVLCLSVVEYEMRSFSMTMQILFIHLVGDFPSPFIIGYIADQTDIRTAMIFCCLWISFAIYFFFLAWIVVRSHTQNKLRTQPPTTDISSSTPTNNNIHNIHEMESNISCSS